MKHSLSKNTVGILVKNLQKILPVQKPQKAKSIPIQVYTVIIVLTVFVTYLVQY